MEKVLKTNGRKAKESTTPNTETVIAAHLAEMREFGRRHKDGGKAKREAIEMWQNDCLSGLVTVANIDSYVNEYCKGAESTEQSKSTFRSQLLLLGNPAVITAWPTLSATLDQLHGAKDKAVSRKVTDKDKTSQLTKCAKRIRDDAAKGTTTMVNAEWIKATVAKEVPSSEEQAKTYRQSILDSTLGLLPEKPTAEQIAAATEFFKAFTIELPEKLKAVAPAKAPAKKK